MKRLVLSVLSIAITTTAYSSSLALAQPSPQSSEQSSESSSSQPGTGTPVIDSSFEIPDTLRVGTKEILPFVFLEEQVPYGYSIDVWNEISSDLGITTEWVRYESVSEMLEGLLAGDIDAAMAGISITAERETAGYDFSYPFYRSGLQMMIQTPNANRWRSALKSLLSWKVWKPFLLVMATSAGVGALIWCFEHRHNDSFSSDPVRGIGQGLWFSIVTLGTFGYGDVTPNKLPARIIACLWMGASFFIVADFIASLTVDQLAASNVSFDDLRGEPIGVVDGTTAENYVRAKPVRTVEFESFDDMIASLEDGEIDAVVHDYPTLQYTASRDPDTFELAGDTLTQEDYGVAFSADAELTEPVSREILSLQEQGGLQTIKEKWFGEESLQ
mgnify:CR=1 FL=1